MTFISRIRKLVKERNKLKRIGITLLVTDSRTKECKWPIGEVGKAGFHFCCREAVEGRSPYCQEHTKIAYRRPPVKRTDVQKALIKTIVNER